VHTTYLVLRQRGHALRLLLLALSIALDFFTNFFFFQSFSSLPFSVRMKEKGGRGGAVVVQAEGERTQRKIRNIKNGGEREKANQKQTIRKIK